MKKILIIIAALVLTGCNMGSNDVLEKKVSCHKLQKELEENGHAYQASPNGLVTREVEIFYSPKENSCLRYVRMELLKVNVSTKDNYSEVTLKLYDHFTNDVVSFQYYEEGRKGGQLHYYISETSDVGRMNSFNELIQSYK